jgi:hypothetical protein
MTEAFFLHGAWKLMLDGVIVPAEFNSKGAALAAIPVERMRRARRDAWRAAAQPDRDNQGGATPGASSVLADELDDQDPDAMEAFERNGPRRRS